MFDIGSLFAKVFHLSIHEVVARYIFLDSFLSKAAEQCQIHFCKNM